MPELNFDGRVAVITGAGRGLGRAYAHLLASRGARVVVNDPGFAQSGEGADATPAEEVVAEIRAAGGQAIANFDSVATPEGGQAIIDAAVAEWGRVDILVHNAGNRRRGPMTEMTADTYNAVLAVHLQGAFHMARAAFPLMAAAKYGRIILTSSIGGAYGDREIAGYCTAKAGVIGLSNVFALEGASLNIKSNVVLPGAVTRMSEGRDTSAFPSMPPELVAPLVGLLAHEACPVSGEMYASVAGRMARVFITETEGVYRPSWTIEDVLQDMDRIRDPQKTVTFDVLPRGFYDHLEYSFARTRKAS